MDSKYIDFAYYLCFFLILLGFISSSSRYKKAQLYKYLTIWFIIFMGLIIIFSFKATLLNNNIIANLRAGYGVTHEDKIKYFIAADGHFYINAKLNNKNIEFLVDTGASDVMLTRQDAELLGINTQKLLYNKVYMTANGPINCASYLIDKIQIKDFIVNDIYVVVSPHDTGKSLLGMRFLQLFTKYEVSNDILTLHK